MSTSRPNVILITTDQQRTDSMSCYGARHTTTPSLDRLAAGGVRCDRAYCANPVCTPSRASIFSGLQVSRHGAWNVGMKVPEDVPMLSHRLAAAGYRTHYVGKVHFEPFGMGPEESAESCTVDAPWNPAWDRPFYGFERWEVAQGHGNYGVRGHYRRWISERLSPEEVAELGKLELVDDQNQNFGGAAYRWSMPWELHNSVWTAERTIAFLEEQDGSQPFFLAVGFQDPHHPHAVPKGWTDWVDPEAVPMPDYDDGELDDKPPVFRDAREGRLPGSEWEGPFSVAGQGSGDDYRRIDERTTRLGRAAYHTLVRLLDSQMGRILDALDELGLAENTLIIFTTDHGELLGDHGIWCKGPFHYEQLVRVPLIVRWPAGLPAGAVRDGVISLVDLVPTVLAAAGVDGGDELDGVNALPMLGGETATCRDAALIECVDNPGRIRLKTIVTADRKLTWHAGRSYGELYDLAADPREKVNRWDDPAYAADKAELLGRLLAMMEPCERRAPRVCYA